MYLVVVTGPIGSGKSLAVRHLEELGARTVSLDKIGHDLLEDDLEVRDELVEAFGKDILDGEGLICRSALARVAFRTPETTARLNAITHPRIVARAAHIINQAASPCIDDCNAPQVMVIEVPLPDQATELLEVADEVVCITAPEETRITRLQARGMSPQDARARISRQLAPERFSALADTVLSNDGEQRDLEASLDYWWQVHEANGWNRI